MMKLYDKRDKRRLYQLMKMLLANQIDAWTFCDEYYSCFDLEIDRQSLSKLEDEVFSELGVVSGRFTNIDEDLIKYPGTYFNENQLRTKIIEVIEKLKVNDR